MNHDAAIVKAVQAALEEDLGPDFASGDITGMATIGNERGTAAIIANEAGVAAGLETAGAVFGSIDKTIQWLPQIEDGAPFTGGQTVAEVRGALKAILAGERTALNFLARLSGVATLTKRFVEAAAGMAVYDTRKTTPGLRVLEKRAVRVGGGNNHRFGLYDAVLIKDNHLFGRRLSEVVEAARRAGPDRLIEVEVEDVSGLREAIAARADMVLLDNMGPQAIEEAMEIARGRVDIEVSGGVNLNNIGDFARLGVPRISTGAITQMALPIDFSMTVLTREANRT